MRWGEREGEGVGEGAEPVLGMPVVPLELYPRNHSLGRHPCRCSSNIFSAHSRAQAPRCRHIQDRISLLETLG